MHTISRETRKKLRITANTIIQRIKPSGKSMAGAAAASSFALASRSSVLPDRDLLAMEEVENLVIFFASAIREFLSGVRLAGSSSSYDGTLMLMKVSPVFLFGLFCQSSSCSFDADVSISELVSIVVTDK